MNSQERLEAFHILCKLFLQDFALTWLQNLHHFLNLHNNFPINVGWHKQSVAAWIISMRLAESDITVMPSVMSMDWLYQWCVTWCN
jgi:hypothetical protein